MKDWAVIAMTVVVFVGLLYLFGMAAIAVLR